MPDNKFMLKQAGLGKTLINWGDDALRFFGRWASKPQRDAIKAAKVSVRGTGWHLDPYLRAGVRPAAEEVLRNRANAKIIERGMGAGTILAGGGLIAAPFLANRNQGAAEGRAAENKFRQELKRDQAKEELRQERAAQAAKDKEYNDKMWRDAGIVFSGSQVGGIAGALMDRRNRLRGYLPGSAVAGLGTGVGLHLYDKYSRG